jgi:hypothetical protein
MARRSSAAVRRGALLPHAPTLDGTALAGAAWLVLAMLAPAPALAVPSFAQQTG